MRRTLFLVPLVVVALAGWAALGRGSGAVAQDVTPSDLAGHPIVGAWLLDVAADDPTNPPALAIFHDDGTYLQADADGSTGVGAWEATGADTAALTALFHGQDEAGGFAGATKVRAIVEVADVGDTLTAEYTLEFVGPDGAGSGEIGPATATAERIAVEPMGSPVASMAEAMAAAEAEATPTS
jgi:hypothetical protein